MRYEIVLRFEIWIRQMILKSICLRWIEIYDKSAVMVTSAVLNACQHVGSAKGVLKQEVSGLQLTTFLGDNNFQNIKGMKLICFSKKRKISCRLRNCNKKMRKCFFFWDNGVWKRCVNFFQIMTRIHVIRSECVTKGT